MSASNMDCHTLPRFLTLCDEPDKPERTITQPADSLKKRSSHSAAAAFPLFRSLAANNLSQRCCHKLHVFHQKIQCEGNDDSILKAIARCLVANFKLFKNNENGTPQLSIEDRRRLDSTTSALRKSIFKEKKFDLKENLETLFSRVLPQPALPLPVAQTILCYLPKDDFSAALKTMRSVIIQNHTLGYRALAQWIDQGKFSLHDLPLTPQEIDGISPFLTYVDLKKMIFPTNEEAQAFIVKFPKMAFLTIQGNKSITSLPDSLHRLIFLNCAHTDIRILPAEMPSLIELVCHNCEHLERLPMTPGLKYLDCTRCPNLVQLPSNMPALKKLRCSMCIRLTTLPLSMPVLKSLDCNGCPYIREFPDLPSVTSLKCNNCRHVPNLPNGMHALKQLYCMDCISLKSLPYMPDLKKLYCHNCVDDIDLLNLPENVDIKR